MSDLSLEAKALRDRISRYPGHTQEELDKILKIEFHFVQLLDLILRLYTLDAQTLEAIARLEESRTWAGLSVKRGTQMGYKLSDYPEPSHMPLAESDNIEHTFAVVLNTILSRCVPNREMDLAIARLDEARATLIP
ncbi:MAG TPA: hypothetical protein V6D14_14035 [Coleofasciculaceae cyanobacterium]|jgi:hypothetical protein